MKAIRISAGKPELIDTAKPKGNDVLVRVASSSICGSDLHLINLGWAEGSIMGHEFAGYTPDGTAVAVEPVVGCHHCDYCDEGRYPLCLHGATYLGIDHPGGMAEYVAVPEHLVYALPSGLDISSACLVEPLAVAVHGLNQARVTPSDRVLILGAGAIGLATAAVLQARGMTFDIKARHQAQQAAARALGGNTDTVDGYDVVIDAVGNSSSVAEAIAHVKPRGRIGMVGSFWQPVEVDISFCAKEIEMISAAGYKCVSPGRTFEEAAKLLHANPHIADTLISHRFPLDGAVDAFNTAADRASGAIKVCFDIAS